MSYVYYYFLWRVLFFERLDKLGLQIYLQLDTTGVMQEDLLDKTTHNMI